MHHRGRKRVALVRVDPDLQTILADLMAEEGCEASGLRGTSADELVREPPDLVLLGTEPHLDTLSLLDVLREHRETVAVPIIVLGTSPTIEEQAHAAGNVYTVLPMPFQLQELVEAVEGALAHVPFERRVQELPASTDPAFQQASELLLRSERELMLGWAQRVRAVPPFRDRPDIRLGEFLNSLPRLLNALALALSHEESAELLADDADVQGRLREHVRLRMRQGLPGEAVVREYQVLRDAIHKHFERRLGAEAALKALERLNWFLDEVIRTTVAEYLRLTSEQAQR